MMKKYIIHTILILSLFNFHINYAQKGERPERQERSEKVKAMKIAYITENLSLTPKEAEKFWPIYNEFSKKRHELRRGELGKIKSKFSSSNFESISKDEANKMLDEIGKIEDKLHANNKDLIANLRKVISPQKIILLKKVDHDFNKRLLDQLKNRRNKKISGEHRK